MFLERLDAVHRAYVVQNDPYPRNVLIVPGNIDRVVWIDLTLPSIFASGRHLHLMDDNEATFKKQLLEGCGRLSVSSDRHSLLLFMI
jgi:hypothetical protein